MAEKSKVPVATLEYEPTAFEQVLLKHKSKLILVSVLAVAGTLGYWGWRLVKESKHNSAALAFTRATSVDELKKVAGSHSGQAAAGDALILAADKQFSESKGSEAVTTLREFLSSYPDHPLRDLATWRLGEYLTAGGDPAGAAKEYETLGQGDSPFAGVALLRLGDMKWGAGEADKAKEYYERILRNPSLTGNPARTEAQERVDRSLKTKPPTLIEYVAPLLPPPKLNEDNTPSPGMPNIPGLPPELQSENFTPPVIPGDIKSPSLLDDPPVPVPAPTPVESNKDNENDNKGAAESGKPATGNTP